MSKTAVVYPIKGSAKSEFTNVGEDQFQQHCIEVTVDKLFEIDGPITLSDNKTARQLPNFIEMETQTDEFGEYWVLEPHSSYNFESKVGCKVAEGECFWLIPRSSFNRCGVRIESSLYDSGFFSDGTNGVIYTKQNPLKLYKGMRVAQVMIVTAETMKLYNGQWQNKTIGVSGQYTTSENK